MIKISAEKIIHQVIFALTSANSYLAEDVLIALQRSYSREESPLGKKILSQILENAALAARKKLPLCQDTGQIEFFVNLGPGLVIEPDGKSLEFLLNEAVRQAYKNLRPSIVNDPLRRQNTRDNTPAIIHYELSDTKKLSIKILVRGGGTDNASTVMMLEPTIRVEDLRRKIVNFVREKAAGACPPVIVAIGLGGSFSRVGYLAKSALLENINERNPDEFYRQMEEELLAEINNTGIGPMGLGGRITALAVKIRTAATHIACLPVGITLQCHSLRKFQLEL